MIRIKRPARVPRILRIRGAAMTRQLCELYDSDPDSYNEGAQAFEFDRSVYGAKAVKDALRKAQHDKCAFCESKVPHIAHGDVEHFRPKAGYRQDPDDTLGRPGYYWLAYEWSNLLFCCQLCNQRFKRNHFPLVESVRRAKSYHDRIEDERPLFVHPAGEEPESVLEFCGGRDGHILRAIGGDPRGQRTIEALGLNRDELAEMRRDALAPLKRLIECRDLIARQVTERPSRALRRQLSKIDTHLKRCASDSAQYASMARATLRTSHLK